MSSRSGLLAGGNWIVDAVKIVDCWPKQDALANIISESKGTGGSPFNVVIDLAMMGARFPLAGVGLVGDDSNGRYILDLCRKHHIETADLQTDPAASTSYTDVMTVQSNGRRTFFHARGANAKLDSRHFDFSQTTARIFHLGYLLLLDRLDEPHPEFGTVGAEVLARAQAAGLKTSIDAVSEDSDRFAKVVLPALKHVDLCVMNEFEAERVTGQGDPARERARRGRARGRDEDAARSRRARAGRRPLSGRRMLARARSGGASAWQREIAR